MAISGGESFDNITAGCEGADELIARLKVLPGACQQAALDSMELFAAEEFMPYLKTNTVPLDNGILADSGDVWREEDQVNLEFGGPGSGAETYAVEQHERMDYHHPIQGMAKYLEIPLIEWSDRFLAAAAEGVRNVLTVGTGDWGRQVVISDFPTTEPTMFDQFMHNLRSGSHVPSAPKFSSAPRLVKRAK